MSSIFRKDDNYVDKPKRNTFDLSKANNLTFKMGELVPVLCQPVYPGDSFKIDPRFALRYMPQVFPVQTRQRASIKYYYVRNRNLWSDWMDFIGRTKEDLVPPFLDFTGATSYHLRPSGTADYLNFPVKVFPSTVKTSLLHIHEPDLVGNGDYVYVPSGSLINSEPDPFSINLKKSISVSLILPKLNSRALLLSDWYGGQQNTSSDLVIAEPLVSTLTNSELSSLLSSANLDPEGITGYYNTSNGNNTTSRIEPRVLRAPMRLNSANSSIDFNYYPTNIVMIYRLSDGRDIMLLGDQRKVYGPGDVVTYDYIQKDGNGNARMIESEGIIDTFVGFIRGYRSGEDLDWPTSSAWDVRVNPAQNDLYWCDVAKQDLPFYSSENPNGMRFSALPFRALQAVYNSHIRNAENNPFMLNGKPEYNKYVYSTDGGAVDFSAERLMDTYFANWSDDRFTTALPSPQQGNAPLVGLTGVNGATVTLGNEDGSQSVVHLQVDSDTGNVVMVDSVSSDSPDYLNSAMMSAVEYGITINDLRNVNAFQKWLENNIRKGYKYKDQLLSHYGVNARFDVLDMPEFIGGVSRDVNVNQITATASTEDAKLGEYAGQSYVMGDGHSIEHYCDEHGFIIGLLSVTPMPIYQDALDKMWLMNDAFDYYFPEFGKIGMQPITKKEISFSQSVLENNSEETFGYQRAWYEMLENLDEVHGLFRTDLRNFLIARDFSRVPELGSQFLTVDPDDVNNTFYVNDGKDKIIGQIYHSIISKRPVPLFGIPSIE